MNAIKAARKLIAADPTSVNARTLSQLVLSLESDLNFSVDELYQLDLKSFDLALEILKEWRLDRYYAGKAKLFDLSFQVSALQS